MTLKFDEIGYWTEVKLDIIDRYATEYSKILSNQVSPILKYVYIDAFAGLGKHFSKEINEFVPGSPLRVLNIINFYDLPWVMCYKWGRVVNLPVKPATKIARKYLNRTAGSNDDEKEHDHNTVYEC